MSYAGICDIHGPYYEADAVDGGCPKCQSSLRDPVSFPPEATYDSAGDTRKHIQAVRHNIAAIRTNLMDRALRHDSSKLEPPEKEAFDRLTPRLAELTYGSQEYKDSVRELGPALRHHYENNSHHPEYHAEQVYGMNLLDLLEMLADWKAASERTKEGSLRSGFVTNINRFSIDSYLAVVLLKTCVELGWLTQEEQDEIFEEAFA